MVPVTLNRKSFRRGKCVNWSQGLARGFLRLSSRERPAAEIRLADGRLFGITKTTLCHKLKQRVLD
jgi:hypothetical protein